MAIRLRVSIALILGITLLFILSASFVPQPNDDDSAIGRGIRKGADYLNPTTFLPATKEMFGLNRSHNVVHSEHLASSPDPNFRLLIGVMSPFWSSGRRQMVRNAYSRFPKDLPVDIVFVKGNMPIYNQRNAHKVLAMEHNVTQWENNTFHDIMHLDCEESIEYGKTYEFFKKIGIELSHKYTHIMKTDDDSFVNIPALVQVIRQQSRQRHLYWGTTYNPPKELSEMWGSGYILGMDLVTWISESEIPPQNLYGPEDWKVVEWLDEGNMLDNVVVNYTAFAGYPWPELGDHMYRQENEVRPFERWILVTHPLKEDFMWAETAEYYLGLEW